MTTGQLERCEKGSSSWTNVPPWEVDFSGYEKIYMSLSRLSGQTHTTDLSAHIPVEAERNPPFHPKVECEGGLGLVVEVRQERLR